MINSSDPHLVNEIKVSDRAEQSKKQVPRPVKSDQQVARPVLLQTKLAGGPGVCDSDSIESPSKLKKSASAPNQKGFTQSSLQMPKQATH